MKLSNNSFYFFEILSISFFALVIYGLFLISNQSVNRRQEKINNLYKEGYTAGEMELNPLLSPYNNDDYYNRMWKKGYVDALIKKKQKAEHE